MRASSLKHYLLAAGAACLSLFTSQARADTCTASMSDISFGNVSPIAGQDYYASGTLSVTCTFVILVGNIIVLPNISACANLDAGAGATDINARMLTGGGRKLPFNLYRSADYTASNIWGSYTTAASINPFFAGLLAVGTNTLTFPVYARIAASDLAGARIDSDLGTTYSTSFAGGIMNYASSSIIALPCQNSGQTAPFSFNVSAKVINDCTITATPLAFGPTGVLNGSARTTGNLAVKCSAGNAYRIALNGGTVTGLPANRRMKNSLTADTIRYQLSKTLDGPIWGDGTTGTATYDDSGTGAIQSLPIYGVVPNQTTPPPGDYRDTVTATVYF